MKTLLSLITLLAIAASAQAATFNLVDQTFSDANWTEEKTGSAPTSYSDTQESNGGNTGGNPDPYRSVTHTLPSGGQFISVFHAHTTTFTPSTQGAINSIRIALDARRIVPSSGGNAIGLNLGIKQGSDYHQFTTGFTFNHNDWQTKDTGIQIDDTNFNGSIDFSETGETISFGFWTSNSTTVFGTTTTGGYDNFIVDIDYNPIPEPTSLLLLGMGALTLLRRKSRNPNPRG